MITEFDDYLLFLNHLYNENKKNTVYFSYEYITQKLGLCSRAYVFRIFRGERKLNSNIALRFANLFKLNYLETDYFLTLVLLSDTSEECERKFLEEKLTNLKTAIDSDTIQLQVA